MQPGTATAVAQKTWLSRIGQRLSSFPTLLVAVLVTKVYWTCRDRIADQDLWWHLRNAQFLVTRHHFPNVDTYSFTTAGAPWINHEWLSELFYYEVFQSFGLRGVFLLFASILAIILVVVFALSMEQAKDPLAAGIATITGGLLAMVAFTPRPQHFGWLCCVAIYAVLLRFRSRKQAPLWLVPALFCLWANVHGSWLIGLCLYVIFVLAGLVRHDIGNLAAHPWSRGEINRLAITGCASVAALFVNPFGYHLLLYPLDTAFNQKLGIGNVQEWGPVNFSDSRGKLVIVVLAMIFFMALISRRRWRIDDALLSAFVLYCGLAHIRFLILAGIVLPPILATQFGNISSYDPNRERRALNALLLVMVGVAMVAGFPSSRMLDSQLRAFFPARAVEFLDAHPQNGRMFNYYDWGGYLEWNRPQEQTFIDSRSDVYEHEGVLKDYSDIANLNNPVELLDRYKVDYVLYPPDSPLVYFLLHTSGWKPVYVDNQAAVLRRESQTAR